MNCFKHRENKSVVLKLLIVMCKSICDTHLLGEEDGFDEVVELRLLLDLVEFD